MPNQIVRREIRNNAPHKVTYQEISAVLLTDENTVEDILANYNVANVDIDDIIQDLKDNNLL